ncbi:MAG: cation:proton antiporter [Candidatus Aenigmatarchaeota archaeon]|nr:MAG: cation:proton antiporter [Candidatus Aenigmarchaeota archaeon]
MALPIIFHLGIIIFVSAVLAYFAKFLKQPLIVAYVVAGVIVGPVGLGLITNTEEIALLSELGIVFLLFSVGLEIDFRRFKHVGFAAFAGGTIQVVFTFLLGFAVAMFFGMANILGVYIGLLLAFSSTMIVAKILADRDELNTLHGRIMLGILLLQDIIAVIALPLLRNVGSLFSLEFAGSIVLRGLGLFAIAILLNRFFFPRILDYAAEKHEILFLTAVANCFFFIGASYVLGFSIAIGGFIAGLSMANFPYNIEIAGEVHALRDFFSIVFFSSLGMQLNFWVMQSMFPMFITLLILVMVLKPIMLTVIYLFLGYGGRTSGYVGLGMGQASEFMFIIAAEMFLIGSITHEFYSFLISIVVVSIVITPYFAKGRSIFYEFFSRFRLPKIHHFIHPKSIHVLENPPERVLDNHIIIFGAHSMGEKIVQYLKDRGEKFVVVERDPEIVKNLSRKGIYVRYGDAENDEVLKKIFLTKAKLLILTIPYADIASFVVRKAKRSSSTIRILARAHTEMDAERLYKAGADIVIIPEFVSAEKIVKKIEHFLREKEL